LRVLYVSTLPRGGPVTHLRDLAPAVAAEGVDVHVVCATAAVGAEFERSGVPTTVLPVNSKFDVRGAARLWQTLRAVDVVHTHDRRAGLFGRLEGGLRGARTVHTLHGIPERIALELGRPNGGQLQAGLADRTRLRLESLLAHLGVVVIPSQALADFVERHGFPSRRVRVLPHGVTLHRTEPAPRRQPAVIGTAATLDYHKGIDVLLQACVRIAEPFRLEIFGEGPARPDLEQLAARLGVPATFHGFVDDFRERVGELDVFVLPTRGDNLPMAILEAMAAAVPVVATRVGGVPELVADHTTGLLVPPDDSAALAAAILRLLEQEELRAELGRAGARRVEQEFESGLIARRMIALYRELDAA
jgi:glycosyltransferase involved in cell wall biosynthesis